MKDIVISTKENETSFFGIGIPFSRSNFQTDDDGELTIKIQDFRKTNERVTQLAEALITSALIQESCHFGREGLFKEKKTIKKLFSIKEVELKVPENDGFDSSIVIFSVYFKAKVKLSDMHLSQHEAATVRHSALKILDAVISDYKKWQEAFDFARENYNTPRFLHSEMLIEETSLYDQSKNTVFFSNDEYAVLLQAFLNCMADVVAYDQIAQRANAKAENDIDDDLPLFREEMDGYELGKNANHAIGFVVPVECEGGVEKNINENLNKKTTDNDVANETDTRLKPKSNLLITGSRNLPKIDTAVTAVDKPELKIKGKYNGIDAGKALMFMELFESDDRDSLLFFNKKADQCSISNTMARDFENKITVKESITAVRGEAFFLFTYNEAQGRYELTGLEFLNKSLPTIGSGQYVLK